MQDALRGVNVTSPPPYLTFQLGRFEMNWNSFLREKIKQSYALPAFLNLREFQTLTGEHEGEGANVGPVECGAYNR